MIYAKNMKNVQNISSLIRSQGSQIKKKILKLTLYPMVPKQLERIFVNVYHLKSYQLPVYVNSIRPEN